MFSRRLPTTRRYEGLRRDDRSLCVRIEAVEKGGRVVVISEGRKLKAIRHLVNDYSDLVWTATHVDPASGHEDIERSHFSFSFLVRQRSLAGFLLNKRYKEKHRKGDIDILAKDYIGSKVRFKLPEWRKWDDHMNAHFFHLGYLRTRNSRSWDGYPEIKRMYRQFTAEWKRFCDGLKEPYLSELKVQVEVKRHQLPGLPLYP